MPDEQVSNADVFLWALYKLGGASGFVEVEDVFVRAFEYAPNRLAWRTKIKLPDLKKCSKGLRDAEARKPRLLIKTPDGYRRQLTVEGCRWVEINRERLESALESGRPIDEPKTRPRARALSVVKQSDALRIWRDHGVVDLKKWQVAEAFQCSPDSPVEVWVQRLQVLRAAANVAEATEVGLFLESIWGAHPEWFGGSE